jgi:hypothetical protein
MKRKGLETAPASGGGEGRSVSRRRVGRGAAEQKVKKEVPGYLRNVTLIIRRT